MYANRRNFRVLQKIGIQEHDCCVRFNSGSGNMAVSCMRNASGQNSRNSSFIVDLATGQRLYTFGSTERISSKISNEQPATFMNKISILAPLFKVIVLISFMF